tara:strand:+ start:151 stop:324 length:174 start_codon:yes stop_codon:yes gene_type:complete
MSETGKYIDYETKEVHHKKLCKICNKPLRRFKVKKYGGNRKDWKRRTTHLKCWKETH